MSWGPVHRTTIFILTRVVEKKHINIIFKKLVYETNQTPTLHQINKSNNME
jgi:hypothetical protein